MKTASAIALTACLATLGLAGCGSSDDEDTSTAGSTVTNAERGASGEAGVDGTETGASGPESAQAEPCPDADSPPNIIDVTAYGVDCTAVEDAMAEVGSISKEFTLGNFECARTSGSSLSGTWRCDGADGYFTFSFGD